MAIKTELINGHCIVTPIFRLGFQVKGINPDHLDQIKEAIRSYFPEWSAKEWWWAYYQHERIIVGEIDGRSFEEETGYDEIDDDDTDETLEVLWMDRVALAVWHANGGFCEFSYGLTSVPCVDGHWEYDDFDRLTSQRSSP
jgi:hypothetical protein